MSKRASRESGERTRLVCWRWRPAIANFSCRRVGPEQACFGEGAETSTRGACAPVPEDDQANAQSVVIISHGLWKRRFGSDHGVVGRQIFIGAKPITITVIGVMGGGGDYPQETQVWMTSSVVPAEEPRDNRSWSAMDCGSVVLPDALTRLIANLLFGVGANDPATFAAISWFPFSPVICPRAARQNSTR